MEEIDDLQKALGDIEVTELDDGDLESATGGGPNTNCGCGGHPFSGEPGAPNNNCGCIQVIKEEVTGFEGGIRPGGGTGFDS
ncbi:MAG TPA: hypothetical protein VMW27_22890 [Thermoanaerobaculia bacterium]|nr:hypothetical protein [Thermoanaerobaculia bacterium]